MKRKNATRNSLITSIISMLLCVSMLVGATFAWFTDEVKTGMNTIAAGNLDVELLADGVEVDAATKLFDNVARWEPGVVVYENLQVANVGSLALRYQLSLNFGSENDLNGHKLSEVLKIAVIDKIDTDATREEVLTTAKASAKVGALADFYITGELDANTNSTEQTFVIFWEPSTPAVDNLYNVNNEQTTSDGEPLHIEFGVNLQATQKMSESDSFNNEYDKNAWSDAMKVYSALDLQAAINAGESAILLMADIEATEAIEIPAGATVAMNLNGKTLTAATSSAMVVNNGTLTVMGGTIENTAVNGGATINNKGTLVLEDGANIVGAPIASDAGNPAYCITNAGNMTIEKGASVSADRGCLFLSGTGATVINGGTLTNNDIAPKINRSFTSHVVVVGYGANNKLTINDGEFKHLHTTTSGGVVINNWSAVTVDVNGGNFSGGNYFGKWDNLSDYGYGSTSTPFSVTGGTFTGLDKNYVADGYVAVTNADGSIVVLPGDVAVTNSAELVAAILAGETDIALADGNYVMPDGWTGAHDTYNQNGYDDGLTGVNIKGKTLTITGSRNAVIDAKGIDSRDQNFTNANLTFDGVTVDFDTNLYMGFMNTASLTYNNCAVNGLQFFGGAGPVAFVDCDLNSNGAEHSVWTWGAQNISFTDCDFTYADRAVNCYGEGVTTNATFTDCTFTKVAGKDTTGAIETNSSTLTKLNLTINNCTVNEGDLWFIAGWDSLSGAKTTATVNGSTDKGVVLVQSGVLPYLTLNSNSTYMLTGDFGGNNVALRMPAGVENVIFDGSNATNINELIVIQNGTIIDNANDVVGGRSGKVTVQNFNVLSQINVFACKTEVVVQKNTAEALMVHAGNCDVKVLNNTIDANFESHPTYQNATTTWNTNDYGIALNIFEYNLWLDGNTVTNSKSHAIGINGWEGTFDTGVDNVIESFKGNTITVNSTTKTARAAFKVWDDETYASNDDNTNTVNATAQAFIDAVLADGSNIFNIVDGYDHTIFCFYNVNTNN